MRNLVFRPLKANEIDCRIGSVSKSNNGVSVLLYKDARVDMNILDETVGPESWQREHYECKGNLYCRVGIRIDDNWIWKSDCGMESNTDAAKGESSDSFKRACVNWGIGRALYTAPFIWINVPKETYMKMGVHVGTINYNENSSEITGLILLDGKGSVVYRWGNCNAPARQEQPVQPASVQDPLEIAIGEVKVCKDREQLTAVWNKWKGQFGKEIKFVQAVTGHPAHPNYGRTTK